MSMQLNTVGVDPEEAKKLISESTDLMALERCRKADDRIEIKEEIVARMNQINKERKNRAQEAIEWARRRIQKIFFHMMSTEPGNGEWDQMLSQEAERSGQKAAITTISWRLANRKMHPADQMAREFNFLEAVDTAQRVLIGWARKRSLQSVNLTEWYLEDAIGEGLPEKVQHTYQEILDTQVAGCRQLLASIPAANGSRPDVAAMHEAAIAIIMNNGGVKPAENAAEVNLENDVETIVEAYERIAYMARTAKRQADQAKEEAYGGNRRQYNTRREERGRDRRR